MEKAVDAFVEAGPFACGEPPRRAAAKGRSERSVCLSPAFRAPRSPAVSPALGMRAII